MKQCWRTIESIFLLVCVSAHALAVEPIVPIGTISARVDRAVDQWADKTGIVVVPSLRREFVASVSLFIENFCYPRNSSEGIERCRKTFDSDQVLFKVVDEFLTQATSDRPVQLASIAERLAQVIGSSISQAGWPPQISNTVGVASLSERNEGVEVFLSTSSGLSRVGTARIGIALPPGTHQLVLRDRSNTESRISVSIAAGQWTILAGKPKPLASASVVGIEPDLTLFCLDDKRAEPKGRAEPFNSGRSLIDSSPREAERFKVAIARAIGIDVRIEAPPNVCDRECERALGAIVTEAIAVWRSGCDRCSENAHTVIRAGQSIWIDARLADRIRRLDANTQPIPSLDLDYRDSSETQRMLAAPAMGVPLKMIAKYEQVSPTSSVGAFVCSTRVPNTPWKDDAQRLLCKRAIDIQTSTIVQPLIRLVPGATSCGPSDAFIACGIPNGGIEISLDGVRYRLPIIGSQKEIALGMSGEDQFDLRAIVIHEIGHWFGVPHPRRDDGTETLDLMADTYGAGKFCISASSLRMLNNAADLRWEYRVKECSGLRRPIGARAGR
jgi:hypothetical protein